MLTSKLSDAVVLILAAGKSERMGTPKFLLKHPMGETFLLHLIAVYQQSGIGEIVVVVNTADFEKYREHFIQLPLPVKVVQNPSPEQGRMLSIRLGVQAFTHNGPCFIHNIDNPFVDKVLFEQLLSHLKETDYVVPVYKGKGGHPILLSEKIMTMLIQPSNSYGDLRQVLNAFNSKRVEVEFSEVILNVNTVEEYTNFIEKSK
jgi:molybdenum cofactor cytidylyltransferase